MTEGTVKWFSQRKGYDFLSTPDGSDVFVHYSDIAGHGFKTLVQGEQVTFEIVQGQNGLRAENVVQKSAPVR